MVLDAPVLGLSLNFIIQSKHPPDLFFRNCKFLAMMDVAIAREIGGLPSSQWSNVHLFILVMQCHDGYASGWYCKAGTRHHCNFRCNLSLQALLNVVQQEIIGPLLYSTEEYKRESYRLNVRHLTNILQCCNSQHSSHFNISHHKYIYSYISGR